MPGTRSSRPQRALRRTTDGPAGPWQDFDEVLDEMLGLFEACRATAARDPRAEDEGARAADR
ncbi:hypothetical protein [Streptomyces sp. WAC06614]|uniref:hypothetical protein n=1 Tax=Streptomyces sp. WAC06614 TaxID=2487416 RepID=UPI00163CE8A0|nr:hypothetical protein [Streptomyces sp. WAC06614]